MKKYLNTPASEPDPAREIFVCCSKRFARYGRADKDQTDRIENKKPSMQRRNSKRPYSKSDLVMYSVGEAAPVAFKIAMRIDWKR